MSRRCQDFERDFGAGAIDRAGAEILSRSARAMEQAIAALPEGTYCGTATCDGHLSPVTLALTLTLKDGRMVLDWDGSSPQVEGSSVNCVWNVTHAHSMVAIKSIVLPNLPNNEGVYWPVETRAPKGSILNAQFPAPVRARSMVSFHLETAIYGALAEVLPDRVPGGSGSFWWVTCAGRDAVTDQPYAVHILPNGGMGAVARQDGHAAMACPGNGTFTPVEIIENRAPLVILERSLRDGSGGAGLRRGGLGQTIRIATRAGSKARMTLRPDKLRHPSPGIAGGKAGAPGSFTRNGETMPIEPFELSPGDVLELNLPGGGGYGDPAARAPQALARDLELGFVTQAQARQDYSHVPAKEAKA